MPTMMLRRLDGVGRPVRVLLRTAVVVAVVLAVVVGVPRRQVGAVPPAEYEAQLAQARHDAPYHLLEAEGLPRGWVVTGVRYDGDVQGAATWHMGFLTPRGRFAGIEQSNGQFARFVRMQTSRGLPAGRAEVAGVIWQKRYRSERDVHSLVRVEDGVSTVVTGDAGWAELVELTRALR